MKEILIASGILAAFSIGILSIPWAVAALGVSIHDAHSWYCENKGQELLEVWDSEYQAYVSRCEMKVTTP